MHRILAIGLIMALAMPVLAHAADEADGIVGVWVTKGGGARVKIEKGTDGKYFGKIIWLKDPNDSAGQPFRDENNPDESKHDQPIIGLKMIKDFQYAGKNIWEKGKIYDPDDGKTYDCQLTLKGPKNLDVRGYYIVRAFGRTEAWTKYEVPAEEEKKEVAAE